MKYKSFNMLLNKIIQKFQISTGSNLFISELDGIRGLAVMLVFFFHAWVLSNSPDLSKFIGILYQFIIHGDYAVDLFFVLSGFLLILPWVKAEIQGLKQPLLFEYLKRRMLRIIPAYYLNLLFLFLILVPIIHGINFLLSNAGFFQFVSHLLFIHYLFPVTSSSLGLNGSLWTLSLEFQFYILLPFIAQGFIKNRYLIFLPLCLIISFLWKYESLHHFLWLTDLAIKSVSQWNVDEKTIRIFISNQFLGQLGHFALGMTLGNIFLNLRFNNTLNKYKKVFTFISIAGLLTVLYLFGKADLAVAPWWYFWRTAIAFGGTCLIYLTLIDGPKFLKRFFGAVWIRIIGLISYGIYLWHLPVIFTLKHFIPIQKFTSMQLFLLFSVLGGIITLSISYCSYIFIEKPFMIKRTKFIYTSQNIASNSNAL